MQGQLSSPRLCQRTPRLGSPERSKGPTGKALMRMHLDLETGLGREKRHQKPLQSLALSTPRELHFQAQVICKYMQARSGGNSCAMSSTAFGEQDIVHDVTENKLRTPSVCATAAAGVFVLSVSGTMDAHCHQQQGDSTLLLIEQCTAGSEADLGTCGTCMKTYCLKCHWGHACIRTAPKASTGISECAASSSRAEQTAPGTATLLSCNSCKVECRDIATCQTCHATLCANCEWHHVCLHTREH